MFRARAFGVVVLAGWVTAACGGSAPASNDGGKTAGANTNPAVSPAAQAASGNADGASTKDVTLADIFPPGRERDLVLNTCGSCHSVACVAQGRRTKDRWENIEKGHKDTVTGVKDADYDAMFAYLEAHFNDTQPEPRVPAKFLAQGCTPF